MPRQFTIPNPQTISQRILAGLNARQLFNPRTMTQDISAGLVLGIESVPDGLAAGLLAFVNPVFGLYGYMVGTFTGAFFTSSVYMAVQVTGAMALIVASVPQVHHPGYGDASVFALAILTGLMMLGAGLFKLGSLLRFVPNAVLTGFINAVAVSIILGQLSNITAYNATGPNKVAQAINLLNNVDQVNLPTLMVGLSTIFLILNWDGSFSSQIRFTLLKHLKNSGRYLSKFRAEKKLKIEGQRNAVSRYINLGLRAGIEQMIQDLMKRRHIS